MSEVRLIDTRGQVHVVSPRENGHRYRIRVLHDGLYILSNWQAPNFRLFYTAVADSGNKANWHEIAVTPGQGSISDFEVFDNHIVIAESNRLEPRLRSA